jgi:magnesium chelatase family protein
MENIGIDDIARRLVEGLPEAARTMRRDLESNFRAVLQSSLGKLDLTTRDEFDVQTKVLERSRALIAQLEQRRATRRAPEAPKSQWRTHRRREPGEDSESHAAGPERAAGAGRAARRPRPAEFCIVGLPAPVVRESRERVRAALLNSGYEFPAGRITVNLAPVELSEAGRTLRSADCAGTADRQRPAAAPPPRARLRMLWRAGSGRRAAAGQRAVSGGAACQQRRARVDRPGANADEVALSGHRAAYGAATACARRRRLARGRECGAAQAPLRCMASPRNAGAARGLRCPRWRCGIGQWQAKRALMIAAAGGHSLLMVGPPGSGKSMLAARLPACCRRCRAPRRSKWPVSPPSPAGLDAWRWTMRPFRSPHHTASAHAIVGGGPSVRPGEISLAHQGVLFLDELPEFDRRVLESLREPLETGSITRGPGGRATGAAGSVSAGGGDEPVPVRLPGRQCAGLPLYAAGITLSAAHLRTAARSDRHACAGAAHSRARAGRRRDALSRCAIGSGGTGAGGACATRSALGSRQRASVECATARMLRAAGRFAKLLERSCEQLGLSGRGMHRVLALVARSPTCGQRLIEPPHLAEAIQLRSPWRRRFSVERIESGY